MIFTLFCLQEETSDQEDVGCLRAGCMERHGDAQCLSDLVKLGSSVGKLRNHVTERLACLSKETEVKRKKRQNRSMKNYFKLRIGLSSVCRSSLFLHICVKYVL